MSIFKINGRAYNVGAVSIIRKPSIDRIDLGKTMDGKKHNYPNGTYFDYEISINTRGMDLAEYDALFEAITNPVEYQTVTMPYGQTEITFDAVVKSGSDKLIANSEKYKKWGNLKFTVEAIKPQKAVE